MGYTVSGRGRGRGYVGHGSLTGRVCPWQAAPLLPDNPPQEHPQMVILSLDPGVTTGTCLGRLSHDRLYIRANQAEYTHLGLFTFLRSNSPNVIVCENFTYRPGPAKPNLILTSLEMIGVVKLYCEKTKTVLYMQEAHEAEGKKAYFNNDRLKSLGLYQKSTPHGLSAMRHLLAWFHFKQGYEFNSGQAILLAS